MAITRACRSSHDEVTFAGIIQYGQIWAHLLEKFDKFLLLVGCEFIREKGDHRIYRRADLQCSLVVPRYPAVSDGSYASTSEFFRSLIRDWQSTMLLSEIQKSQKEIVAGKGKALKSLKDLR